MSHKERDPDKKEDDRIRAFEREKVVTDLMKSLVDAANESGLCRFRFKIEIE